MSVEGFTHHDPFEDTESGDHQPPGRFVVCFTHHDPFEDTESSRRRRGRTLSEVSPTTIRLRILKDWVRLAPAPTGISFTHHDPFEDTESHCQERDQAGPRGFTHHDPFEDTERCHSPPRWEEVFLFHPPRSV